MPMVLCGGACTNHRFKRSTEPFSSILKHDNWVKSGCADFFSDQEVCRPHSSLEQPPLYHHATDLPLRAALPCGRVGLLQILFRELYDEVTTTTQATDELKVLCVPRPCRTATSCDAQRTVGADMVPPPPPPSSHDRQRRRC